MERITSDVPLGAAALGLFGGVLASSQGATLASIALGLSVFALTSPRVRAWGLSIAAGVLLSSPPLPVAMPGVYEIEARLRHVGRPFRHRVTATLAVQRIDRAPCRASLRLRVPAWLAARWSRGAEIHAVVRLLGADARGSWIGVLPDPQAIQRITPRRPDALEPLRARANQVFDRALPEEHAAVARAMVLGDRSALSGSQRSCFRDTGQAHLLAVSGLHVGLWLTGLVMGLRWAGLGPRVQALLCLLAVCAYVPLTGGPPSAVRAGAAVALYVVARLAGRSPAPLGVVSLVAFLLLLFDAHTALEVAFQLSFSAVLGILWFTRPITHVLVAPRPALPGVLRPRRTPIRGALAVSLAAWLGTLPVVAGAIGHASPAGPILAVVAIPLTAVVLFTNMMLLALGWLPIADVALAWAAQSTIEALCGFLGFAQALGVRAVPIATPTLEALLGYGAASVMLVRASSRPRAAGTLATLVAAITAWWVLASPPRSVHGYHPRSVSPPPPLSTLPFRDAGDVAILAAALIGAAAVAVRMRWLTRAGAACAWALGMLAGWTFGAPGLGALFAPFLVATLLGKLPGHERTGARTSRQVLSNGLPSALGCALALLGHDVAGTAFFLGGLACLGSDSCATEVGMRYGGSPWSLTGRKVSPGESGGMTWAGTGAAVAGAVLAPLGWFALAGLDGAVAAILCVGTAGFAASLLDSLLGATLQYRGRIAATGAISEARHVDGVATEPVRGLLWIDNDAVNLLSGLAGGAVTVALWNLGFGGTLG